MAASSTFFLIRNKLFILPIIDGRKNFFLHCSYENVPKNPNFLPTIRYFQSTPEALSTQNQERRPNVVDILEERGLLESITSENLRSACSDPHLKPLKVYCGFDPTAESLHLGNLIGLIVLSWFQRCGHETVALIGGAAARIGDPSGKSLERPQLDVKILEKNTLGIQGNINTILGRWDKNRNLSLDSNLVSEQSPVCSSGFGQSFKLLNNFDWWKDVSFHQFLEKVGRFSRVSTMIAKESVKKRLEAKQGISYTEFAYQLLQGYDFLYLFENEGVNVQIGGSDQWGNITAGTELIRKSLRVEGAYGLTFPLLLKSDGAKFGKSEDGTIWLSPSMLSPYKFYQYFLTVPDVDVVRFLTILTFLSMEEIRELEKGMRSPGYVPNSLQKRLAQEVTRFVHGEDGLMKALRTTEASTFGAEMSFDGMAIMGIRIAEGVPSCSLANEQLLDACLDLSVSTDLLESKSKSCRLIKQRGLYLENDGVENEGNKIEASNDVFNVLEERGLLDLMTSENLRSTCSDPNLSPLTVYCGFDPTAESLHLGNLLGLILLSWFQRCGHKVVALIGGPQLGLGTHQRRAQKDLNLTLKH